MIRPVGAVTNRYQQPVENGRAIVPNDMIGNTLPDRPHPGTPVAEDEGMQLSIVVPARNERALIRRSLQRIARTLDGLDVEYEIILGDSASSDETVEEALAAGIDRLRVVRDPLPGKGRILTRALSTARGSVVGFIDADLEIAESYIPTLYEAVLDGADAAIASKGSRPELEARRPLYRRAITAVVNRCIRLAFGTSLRDHQAGLKLFRGPALRSVLGRVANTGWLWDTEVLVYLTRAGATVAEVPVEVSQREGSHLAFGRSWLGAARDLTTLLVRTRLGWGRGRSRDLPVAESAVTL